MSTTEEASPPRTTYCPFKAPAQLNLPIGGQAAALRRFEQRPGMALVHAAFPDSRTPSLASPLGARAAQPRAAPAAPSPWPAASHLQIVFISQGQLSLIPETLPPQQAESGSWLIVKPARDALRFRCGSACRAFWIEFDLQAAQSLTGFSDTVSPQLLSLDQPYLSTGIASRRLLALAHELARLEGETTRERLLIESKTLEWLALLLDQPAFSPCRAIAPQRQAQARDEAALAAAARILQTRCHEAHSIAQLSRAVHLNEFKLKRGFRERFGTTVFGFLRQQRMESARALLQNGSRSVIEVANAVGYSNPSHFARAFKDAFGLNPSELLADALPG